VGTGSTVNHFIAALAARRSRIAGTVSSSEASAKRLREAGIAVMDLNATDGCDVYVDGADEVTEHLAMIKGGGGASRARRSWRRRAGSSSASRDASKLVPVLGGFPLPVEVIPMARSLVARQIVKLGGRPVLREGVVTTTAT